MSTKKTGVMRAQDGVDDQNSPFERLNSSDKTRRFVHATYASFANRRSGGGGWRIGDSVGGSPLELEAIQKAAPTVLKVTNPVDEFISTQSIEQLPRRLEYKTLNIGGEKCGLYTQAVPAGKDATGRPNNIFTHAVIDRNPKLPTQTAYPIRALRSPTFLTPFRAVEVNQTALPADSDDIELGPFSDIRAAWTTVFELLGSDRSEVVYRLQDALMSQISSSTPSRLPVILAPDDNVATRFLVAMCTTMPSVVARTSLRFSTFERASTLKVDSWLSGGPSFVVVPNEDEGELKDSRLEVIHLDGGDDGYKPQTLWSRLTQALITSVDAGVSVCKAIEEFGGYDNQSLSMGLAVYALNNAAQLDWELKEDAQALVVNEINRLISHQPAEHGLLGHGLDSIVTRLPDAAKEHLRRNIFDLLHRQPMSHEEVHQLITRALDASILRGEEVDTAQFVSVINPETRHQVELSQNLSTSSYDVSRTDTQRHLNAFQHRVLSGSRANQVIRSLFGADWTMQEILNWLRNPNEYSPVVSEVISEGNRPGRLRQSQLVCENIVLTYLGLRFFDPISPVISLTPREAENAISLLERLAFTALDGLPAEAGKRLGEDLWARLLSVATQHSARIGNAARTLISSGEQNPVLRTLIGREIVFAFKGTLSSRERYNPVRPSQGNGYGRN